MKSTRRWSLVASLLAAILIGCLFGTPPFDAIAAAPNVTESKLVEGDMHEFMEYYFQPTYLRLKEQMATEPADGKAWSGIKSNSLILAEGGNLLLLRQPDKDPTRWQELSGQVRELGGQLYQSAKKKDFKATRQHYEAMLNKCNTCHQQFADGEHQLKP